MMTGEKKMEVKFFDLKKVNQVYSDEISSAIKDVIDSGWFILGDRVAKFEDEFADYCNVNNCVSVGNGLDALRIILQSYIELGRLKEGDAVIVPSNSFIATALAVTMAGLKPLFVEPDPETFNLNIEKVRPFLKEAKAVISVHLFGRPSEIMLDDLNPDILLVEDAAQAHGAKLNGTKAGNIGNAAGFSFYPAKNLGAFGDGGAITTNDSSLADVALSLRNYGSTKKYDHNLKGINSRLDEIQAAILSIKLKYLEEQNERRRQIAKYYNDNITNERITTPKTDENLTHVYHQYVIKCDERNDLARFLFKKDIHTMIHYPKAITEYAPFVEFSEQVSDEGRSLHSKILSIPISPALTDEEVDFVVDSLNEFI